MTLRESLGEDVRRIHELVDALLDREDAILALCDGARVVSFANGFGASASQLELLSVELEYALRSVVGPPASGENRRRNHARNQRCPRAGSDDRNSRGGVNGVLRLAGKIA
jgi:hypothetical protein